MKGSGQGAVQELRETESKKRGLDGGCLPRRERRRAVRPAQSASFSGEE
jgi:hypothetical protein